MCLVPENFDKHTRSVSIFVFDSFNSRVERVHSRKYLVSSPTTAFGFIRNMASILVVFVGLPASYVLTELRYRLFFSLAYLMPLNFLLDFSLEPPLARYFSLPACI